MFTTVGGGSAQHLRRSPGEFERYMSKAANSLQVMSEDGRLSRHLQRHPQGRSLIEVGSQAVQIFAKNPLAGIGCG